MIKNLSKKTIISAQIKQKSGISKIFGLIGREEPEAIIFKTRFGIHTFFLKFPIDILVLDKNNNIASLKEGLKPWMVFFWNIKYDTLVELPAGSIKKSKTQRGDKIKLDL